MIAINGSPGLTCLLTERAWVPALTVRKAISAWWNAADTTKPGPWLADCLWNPAGKPPTTAAATAQQQQMYDREQQNQLVRNASAALAPTADSPMDAPPVPSYTSRYFCNPTVSQ